LSKIQVQQNYKEINKIKRMINNLKDRIMKLETEAKGSLIYNDRGYNNSPYVPEYLFCKNKEDDDDDDNDEAYNLLSRDEKYEWLMTEGQRHPIDEELITDEGGEE